MGVIQMLAKKAMNAGLSLMFVRSKKTLHTMAPKALATEAPDHDGFSLLFIVMEGERVQWRTHNINTSGINLFPLMFLLPRKYCCRLTAGFSFCPVSVAFLVLHSLAWLRSLD